MTNTRFNTIFKVLLALFFFTVFTYIYVWVEMYSRTSRYYEHAMELLNAKDYALAIKGQQVFDAQENAYIYKGGFQQIVIAWEHPFALPRPKMYRNAKDKIHEIITMKISAEEGMEIFKMYFRLDNRYLGEILLRVGDIYREQQNIEKAKEIYSLITEIFTLDETLSQTARERLSTL